MYIERLREEYREKLQKIIEDAQGDVERQHAEADNLLCDLLTEMGFGSLVDDYRDIKKWFA